MFGIGFPFSLTSAAISDMVSTVTVSGAYNFSVRGVGVGVGVITTYCTVPFTAMFHAKSIASTVTLYVPGVSAAVIVPYQISCSGLYVSGTPSAVTVDIPLKASLAFTVTFIFSPG